MQFVYNDYHYHTKDYLIQDIKNTWRKPTDDEITLIKHRLTLDFDNNQLKPSIVNEIGYILKKTFKIINCRDTIKCDSQTAYICHMTDNILYLELVLINNGNILKILPLTENTIIPNHDGPIKLN